MNFRNIDKKKDTKIGNLKFVKYKCYKQISSENVNGFDNRSNGSIYTEVKNIVLC